MAVCALVRVSVWVKGKCSAHSLCESDGYIALELSLADIQNVCRYPEAAAEKCNLSHSTGPGCKVDKETGREAGRERGCLWVELSKGHTGKGFKYFASPYLTTPVFPPLPPKYGGLVHLASIADSHCFVGTCGVVVSDAA